MNEKIEIVRKSIKELAGVCDYASSVDGAGFNKTDTGFGHSLATQETWTDKQAKYACRLVIKYHKQLPHVDVNIIRELMGQLEERIQKVELYKETQITISLLTTKEGIKKLAVVLPYNKQAVDKIKTLEGRKWNAELLRWELTIQNLQRLKEMFPLATFSDGIKDYEGLREQKDKLISEEFKKISADIDLTKQLPNGKTPFKHQQTGILRMLKYRRQILADDMGLGKTLQALVVAKELSKHYGSQIIIICPVSLKENWAREAKSIKIPVGKISIYSWAKIPEPGTKEYIMIADEAHYAQAGTKTLRGKAFLKLAGHDNCKACYCLTGTPIKNGRPINIFPLLQATRHELAGDTRYFQTRFCNAHLRELGRKNKRIKFWDTSGSSHLDELHQKTTNIMIRRTKKECLDLPDKLRVLREAELSQESIDLYNRTLDDLRNRYQERIKSGEIKDDAEAMVMLQHLAHAGAIGKVDSAYELAEEVVEEGNQVVIFSTFIEPLKTLRDKFNKANIPVDMLIGETKERQKLVDNFLAGKSRVFLLSMAGGVGIDLYTATTIILINRAWTPGDVLQIEDRLHRIGQKNQVTSIWLQHGEVDIHVDAILESKSMNISQVLQSKNREDDVITFAKKFFKGN
jgi:SNF2 family DNA or RNA helicase